MSDHDNPTDEELALGAQGGSERDFAALVDRHTPAVYRLARGITGGAQDAEDVVQETFLRAFKHIENFSPGTATFKTWLLTIARNQSINIFSSLKRRTMRFLNEGDVAERGGEAPDCLPFGSEQDCERLLALKQECSRVELALKVLPERQRTAVPPKGAGGLDLRRNRKCYEHFRIVRGIADISRSEAAVGDS